MICTLPVRGQDLPHMFVAVRRGKGRHDLSIIMLFVSIVPRSVIGWNNAILFCQGLLERFRRVRIVRVLPDKSVTHSILPLGVCPPVTLPVEFG